MIEESLLQHLRGQKGVIDVLTTYADEAAVFSQEAPADSDRLWKTGAQYPRIVFAVDLQGDHERIIGGTLVVEILCKKDEKYPEDIEPILRPLIHGYFFSSGTFTVSAQWQTSDYFSHPTDQINGCTLTFELLAFPVLTTSSLDVVARLNEWTSQIDGLYVINHDELPTPAWKPGKGESAVYWRRLSVTSAQKIRTTYATIWRTATIKGHIFAEDIAAASAVADDLVIRLYTAKRLLKPSESPIMVDDRNTQDDGADPLRTGQLTVEATYAITRYRQPGGQIKNIKYT